MRKLDLQNQRFGKWTVLERVETPKNNSPSKPTYWKCRCDCGSIRVIPAHNLRNSQTHSCGECYLNGPPYVRLFEVIKQNSKHRKQECLLTFEQFLTFTKVDQCHYCHAPVRWVKFERKAYNLDRKNSDKGYSIENCVVCCQRCNFAKSNRYTYEEWFEMNRCFREGRVVLS